MWAADPGGRRVPQGLAGELVVAGPGVALGYLQDGPEGEDGSDHTPFGTLLVDGAPMRRYRTGDYGFEHVDGTFEFLGRLDAQVKHRGFRIELTGVEQALERLDGVRQAAAVLFRDPVDGGTRLHAVVVLRPGARSTAEELRHQLRSRLPEYMVPDRIAEAASIPMNDTGKVDRAAVAAHALTPPRGRDQQRRDPVRAAVEAVLGTTCFEDEDNLLEVGLHSLQAPRLLRQLRVSYGPGIRLADVLDNASVAGLRAALASDATTNREVFRNES
jgi:acyl-coenzyme A synthetase/AMP-(fatty) acid ligase